MRELVALERVVRQLRRIRNGAIQVPGIPADAATTQHEEVEHAWPALRRGSGNHRLELGAGAVFAHITGETTSNSAEAFGSDSGVVGTAIAGYR